MSDRKQTHCAGCDYRDLKIERLQALLRKIRVTDGLTPLCVFFKRIDRTLGDVSGNSILKERAEGWAGGFHDSHEELVPIIRDLREENEKLREDRDYFVNLVRRTEQELGGPPKSGLIRNADGSVSIAVLAPRVREIVQENERLKALVVRKDCLIEEIDGSADDLHLADVALALTPADLQGMRVAPEEPTEAMITAGDAFADWAENSDNPDDGTMNAKWFTGLYRAMLAARPKSEHHQREE